MNLFRDLGYDDHDPKVRRARMSAAQHTPLLAPIRRRGITARLVARREAAAAEWRRAAKINVQWGQRARRHLHLWDTLLNLWTLRGRR